MLFCIFPRDTNLEDIHEHEDPWTSHSWEAKSNELWFYDLAVWCTYVLLLNFWYAWWVCNNKIFWWWGKLSRLKLIRNSYYINRSITSPSSLIIKEFLLGYCHSIELAYCVFWRKLSSSGNWLLNALLIKSLGETIF